MTRFIFISRRALMGKIFAFKDFRRDDPAAFARMLVEMRKHR